MIDHPHAVDLVALYVLDALEPAERDAFERQLQSCEQCATELADYADLVAQLTPDEPAPAHLWDRIAAEIHQEDANADVVDLTGRRPRRVWKGLLSVAAAAALVVASALGIQRFTGDDLLGEPAVVAAAEEAAARNGSLVADFLVGETTVARVIVTAEGQGFVVPTDELETIDTDRTYQLWVVNTEEAVISAGVLGNEPAAATFTWTGDIAGFALTREVAGGVVSSEGDVVSVITDI